MDPTCRTCGKPVAVEFLLEKLEHTYQSSYSHTRNLDRPPLGYDLVAEALCRSISEAIADTPGRRGHVARELKRIAAMPHHPHLDRNDFLGRLIAVLPGAP